MLTALLLATALQVPAPPAPEVKAPLDQSSAAEGWVWAERSWAPPAEAKDLAGGRFQALLGAGRYGFALRADVSGMPGEFDVKEVKTFRTAELHLAAHRNLLALQGGVQVGVAAGIGAGIALAPEDGIKPTTPNSFTGGLGLRVAGPGWWAYVVGGQHQAIRGTAATLVYQVRTSSRTAAVGTFALGPSGTYFAQFGVAVRWF